MDRPFNKPALLKKMLLSKPLNQTFVSELIISGSIEGYYTHDEFFNLTSNLAELFPQYLSPSVGVGKTFLGKSINALQLGELKNKAEKSHILVISLMHAREMTTLSTIIKVIVHKLHDLIHRGPELDFFDMSDLIFVPVLNRDSYEHITNAFGTADWETARFTRKNMNDTIPCRSNKANSGVDLNRNFGFKFAFDNIGSSSDPCDETNRGARAFSERETQTVGNLVYRSRKFSSSLDFHSYGDEWIQPYSYTGDVDQKLFYDKNVYAFYESINRKLKALGIAKTGNSAKLLNYTANGEASDWLLGDQRIISMCAEVGSKSNRSENFFLSKKEVLGVVETTYPAVQLWLSVSMPLITNVKFWLRPSKMKIATPKYFGDFQVVISFKNEGITDLRSLTMLIGFNSTSDVSAVSRIEFNKDLDNPNAKLETNLAELKIKPHTKFMIRKLSDNQIVISFIRKVSRGFTLYFYKLNKEIFRVQVDDKQISSLFRSSVFEYYFFRFLILLIIIAIFFVFYQLLSASDKPVQVPPLAQNVEQNN